MTAICQVFIKINEASPPFWYCAYQTVDGVRHFRSTKTADKRKARQICDVWAKTSALGAKLTPEKARQVIGQGVADILMASGQTMPSAKIRDWCKRWLDSRIIQLRTQLVFDLKSTPKFKMQGSLALRRLMEK